MNTPSPTDPKTVVIKVWEAFASRDPARIGALFHENAEWIAPLDNATAVALGATSGMVGRDSIVRFITEDFRKLFVADVQIDFRGVYADGDVVTVEQRTRATLVNGRPYDLDYCWVFKVEDGRVRQMREYMDTLTGRDMVFGPGEPSRRLVA
jgi:ketosteroid isomerase-like protein